MSLPVALSPGTMIGGHYIIGNLINSGGFGSVYRGVDTSEGNRPCAIKETYDVTPTARRQALLEAGVLFTVRSPHLPEVYDALEANGRFYLIMQLVEGQNLLQILKSRIPGGIVGEAQPQRQQMGPCSEQEVLSWLLPIIDILQDLHSRNPPIIHRDIKPGNIILAPQHIPVLVDFGLTRLYDPQKNSQTIVKAVSPGFSPLEQYIGKTSPQSDIYSMAATMYLLLTNRLPPAAVQRTVRDDLPPPRLLNPTLSPKVERILLKALAVEPAGRYQSMRAFATALREPAFQGYSEATISVPAPSQPMVLAPMPAPTIAAQGPGTPTIYPYVTGPAPIQHGYQGIVPPPPGFAPPRHGAPLHTAPATLGPGKLTPTEPLKNARRRSVPAPGNQGCLWGIIEGILTGVLALSSQRPNDIFLCILIGLFFYALAGYITTRRGGSSLRGGWAGYWTGIWGTLTFWVTFGSGLIILFFQNLQKLPDGLPLGDATREAWSQVQPTWPFVSLFPAESGFVNVLAWLGFGIVLAWLVGWIGGMLGSSNHRKKNSQQNTPAPQTQPGQMARY